LLCQGKVGEGNHMAPSESSLHRPNGSKGGKKKTQKKGDLRTVLHGEVRALSQLVEGGKIGRSAKKQIKHKHSGGGKDTTRVGGMTP